MKTRAYTKTSSGGARNERGFALIAVLALAALISAYLITTALNPTSSELIREREQRSMNALRQAKAALIAYAASEQWQLSKGEVTTQPGALPCPDRDDDGDADCILPNTTSLIGRLPWSTIGIEDVRDSSGERLWYALSANFRKASGTTIINSDTQACDTPACAPGESHLTLTGVAAANNVVAVLFAPGEALIGQNRPSLKTDPAHNNAANYLEAFSLGDGIHFTFATSALPSGAFNDRHLVITQEELMAVVEPVVAARIERDIKPRVQNYVANWGAYPFAAQFGAGGGPGRVQSAYKGSLGQTNGLLPITNDPSGSPLGNAWLYWRTSGITVVQTGGSGTIDSVDCSSSTETQVRCRVDYDGSGGDRPIIHLSAILRNAALSFAGTITTSNVSMIKKDGTGAVWTSGPAFGHFAQSTGDGIVTVSGRLDTVSNNDKRVTIFVTPPTYHAITSSTDPNSGWFIANQWYRQTYFAVAAGYLPGGTGCTAPNCITVNNLPPGYAPADNKRAILVLSGRALNGAIRPTILPVDYFEAENATPADRKYEHRVGPPGLTTSGGPAVAINDRVVVLAP